MKKTKKIVLIIVIVLIILSIGGFVLYRNLVDENALSINEKKWLDENSVNLISIAIPNDVPVFGSSGEGVFFDFVKNIEDTLGLEINKNMVSRTSTQSGYRFEITTEYQDNGLLLYRDHYVLVSKNTGVIENSKEILDLQPGIVKTDLNILKQYYSAKDNNFVLYDDLTTLTKDLGNGKLEYALVPLTEYKDVLLANDINVITHISDLKKYYYFFLGDNETINSIFSKTFNKWLKKSYEKSYNENNYALFIKMLNISEAEEDTLTNKVYKYGFVENRPYEILASGEYGGITAQYLQNFAQFSDVEFTFKKYKTPTLLAEAAIKNNIDLYYNYYSILTNYIDTGALKNINYVVIADNSIDLSLTNINGLEHQDVYVMENTYLYDYIKDIEGINVIPYAKSSDLKKIIKGHNIIVVDTNTYNYYINRLSTAYSVRYSDVVGGQTYSFRYKNDDDTFYRLFNAYTKTIDPQDLLRGGIITYNKVDTKGKIIGSIAINILLFVAGALVVLIILYTRGNKLKLNIKIKKEDKVKYIDLLTSLKNRNYYNDKLNTWNKNTIYPQACVVMDINRVKELNDTYGHEEGDKQICAVANVLIKTQIDNSEIIRTDGNEFLVYLVGYSEKQIVSYMNKLLKEFKKLPYDFGVAMGFSIIDDDTKLVEDAFNEASIKMRENKNDYEVKND